MINFGEPNQIVLTKWRYNDARDVTRTLEIAVFSAEDQVIVKRNVGRGDAANLSRSWPERNPLLL